MKKIKYVNSKKQSQQSKELADLKGDDDLCGAVLDTLSQDYLSYISHLVKNSKTPVKKKVEASKQYHSSDTQSPAEDIANNLQQYKNIVHYNPQPEKNNRQCSQSESKSLPLRNNKNVNPTKAASKLNNIQRTQQNKKHQEEVLRNQARHRGLIANNQQKSYSQSETCKNLTIKNNQKTLAFTQNRHYPIGDVSAQSNFFGKADHTSFMRQAMPKKRVSTQVEDRRYEQPNEREVSIRMQQMKESSQYHINTETDQGRFINNIDQYLYNLQFIENPHSQTRNSKEKYKNGSRPQAQRYKKDKSSDQYGRMSIFPEENYSRSQIDQILKENLKLKKKVKGYQSKIEQLEDEVSSHLIQCRKRDKQGKKKISELVQALTQAIGKINIQKQQIDSMKGLLRTFGRKAKQMESRDQESDSAEQQYRESIAKMMRPSRAISDLKIKKKFNLQQTMPKHPEENAHRFW